MVGKVYKCSEVAEAAANARGKTNWAPHPTLANTLICSTEHFQKIGTKISPSEIQPGDILHYPDGGWGFPHVAVYIGNGMAVHGNFTTEGMTKIARANYTTMDYAVRIE